MNREEQVIPLSVADEEFFRLNSKELLRQSLVELAHWRRTNNVAFLQQASEKAFNVLEQVTSVKSHRELGDHGTFTKVFRKTFPGKGEVLRSAHELHQFFYNGLIFEPETKVIEEKLKRVLSFVKGVRA